VLDALALAAQVRAREVSPLELVEAAIARIEATNGQLNFLVTECYLAAREAAGGSLPDGPFAGVPMLVKDLTETMMEAPGVGDIVKSRSVSRNYENLKGIGQKMEVHRITITPTPT